MTNLETQLMIDEGFRSNPYKDTVGVLTVGYGRNLDNVGISKDEAYYMLQNDIKKVRLELSTKLSFFKNINEVRQEALINIAFNLGTNGLLKFVNTLRLLNQSKYTEAAQELLKSDWASQVGDRAVRISNQIKYGI
jgi:lysozyme